MSSSVPEDLRIATPDESPQIKRRKSNNGDKPPPPARMTVAELAERMKTFIQEMGRQYEDIKAAHEEVRLIAKEAEKTNELMFTKMTEIEKKLEVLYAHKDSQDRHIMQSKQTISSLKKQIEGVTPSSAPQKSSGTPSTTPSAKTSSSPPATVPKSGTVVAPSVKNAPVKPSSPPTATTKKPSQELIEVDWDDPYCAKCNTDYKKGHKHVCKEEYEKLF